MNNDNQQKLDGLTKQFSDAYTRLRSGESEEDLLGEFTFECALYHRTGVKIIKLAASAVSCQIPLEQASRDIRRIFNDALKERKP